jgi:branched-chain amino acid transport system permease protein
VSLYGENMRIEHKRARLVFHIKDLKLEWTIEPRYWRNPLIGVAGLALLPLVIMSKPDYLTLLTTANIYAAIAIPLAWQMAGIGRMNFGPQFFVGIGGFTAALLSIHWGWGPWQTLGIVILLGLGFGLILSPLTTIAKGLYFSLITLILPLIFLEFTYVYTDIFKGETGLSGIAHLVHFGRIRTNYIVSCYLSLGMMLIFLYVVDKILRSRIGLYAAAINDDEDVAETCGLNINWWKVLCFTITSVLIAVTGWFAAHYYGTFAGITYLQLPFMVKILLIVMIGGRGELYGAIVGAYFVAFLEQALTILGPIHYIVFPLVLLALLFTLPEGLYGIYRRHKYREYYPTMRVRKR